MGDSVDENEKFDFTVKKTQVPAGQPSLTQVFVKSLILLDSPSHFIG